MSKPSSEEIRKKLLSAARSEFIEKGYDRVSIRTIGKKAGKHPSHIYVYFAGKPEIFNEIVKDVPLTIHGAVDFPEEMAMIIEKKLSESGTLIKKLSELQPETLISLL